MERYERTKLEIFERCERGEISDTDKEVLLEKVDDVYMEKFDLSSVTAGIKAAIATNPVEAIAIAGSASAALAGIIGIVHRKNKTKRGYDNDKELKELAIKATKLKSEIETYKTAIDKIYDDYKKKVDEYNEIAHTCGAPTITTTDVTYIPTQRYNGSYWETDMIPQYTNRETQNVNYNPVKAKVAKNKADEINKIVDKYRDQSYKLYECIMETRKLKKRADELARKTKAGSDKRETGKADISSKLGHTKAKYNAIKKINEDE